MNRPLASVIVTTYNQENFIGEAIASIFNQDYFPLEIIIADDASTDKTREKITEIVASYRGTHSVKLIFNDVNLGICGNFNRAISHATGEFIFGAAGDDISHPTRCSKVINIWLQLEKKPGLIATDAYDMSIKGEILGIKKTSLLHQYKDINDWIKYPPYFFGASHSWSKVFLNKFPPINPKMHAEDHLMVFRAIISDGAYTISEPLVQHRRGGVTAKKYMSLQEKVVKLKAGFEDKFLYLQQLLLDSGNNKEFNTLKKYLEKDLEECKLTAAIFSAKSLAMKIKLCLRTSKVSPFFKIKILTYGAFPSILKPFFLIKKIIKKN